MAIRKGGAAAGRPDRTIVAGHRNSSDTTLPIGPTEGFLLEVVLISPIALGFIVYLTMSGSGHFFGTGPLATGTDTLLLAASGLNLGLFLQESVAQLGIERHIFPRINHDTP